MNWKDRLTSLMLGEGMGPKIPSPRGQLRGGPPGTTTQDLDSMEGARGRLRSASAGGPRRAQAAAARPVHSAGSMASLKRTSTEGVPSDPTTGPLGRRKK